MKKNKQLIITVIITLLPIIPGLILYPDLPARVPTHWGVSGTADGTTPKLLAVVGLPLFLAAINIFCYVVMRLDPKRKNQTKFMRLFPLWMIAILSCLIQVLILATALGSNVNISAFVLIFIGVLFTLIGNYLPKVSQNYTAGIKLPWTLDSKDNWRATHRIAGYLWVVCGLFMTLSGLISFFVHTTVIAYITVVIIAIAVCIPIIYSYQFYKKEKAK